MNNKRRATPSPSRESETGNIERPSKRHRVSSPQDALFQPQDHGQGLRAQRDIISELTDEILLRVLSYLSPQQLLSASILSRHFHRLTSDSQLWRPHYYRRFVLPRAHLIPGFRDGAASGKRKDFKLRFGGNVSLWADGGYGRLGSGGLVESTLPHRTPVARDSPGKSSLLGKTVNWRQAYKLRHNWERGRCAAAEELPLHDVKYPPSTHRTLARFMEGLAVTVDAYWGVRIWDLRTRTTLVQKGLDSFDAEEGMVNHPTCLTLDGSKFVLGILGVSVGFEDGTFAVWNFDLEANSLSLVRRHRDEESGALVSLAYLHPYIMTASDKGFILLYTLDDAPAVPASGGFVSSKAAADLTRASALPAPYLLNSLRSRDIQPARALSIRRMASSVVASFAWTFDAIGGWCIAVQDIDIKPSGIAARDVITSRIAFTLPTPSRRTAGSSSEGSPLRTWWPRNEYGESDMEDTRDADDGPVRLCYNHPYLLATMPDNTLLLHLCRSTADGLSISQGTRLFGHTSGISDAVITPDGKAVSVSSRGDEIRLWELEGGVDKPSVEVRPRSRGDEAAEDEDIFGYSLDERKSWVGFDEEMVIVLKERDDGRESFMVYDFT